MVRSSLFVRAVAATIGVLPLVGAAATAAAAPAATAAVAPAASSASVAADDETEPLAVTLTSMSPSTVPRRGPITLTGTVTNTDTESWQAVNLYAFQSASPMTTEAELSEAAEVPVDQDVGERLRTEMGALETIDELAPGDTYDFTVEVPRDYLELTTGGVYWFGIHALGEGPRLRDLVADGRARTFLPYVPANARGTIETALVIPLRRRLAFEEDGSVANLGDWTRTLEAEGRMRGLVDFGAAAGSSPVTWLIDPALPDAVRRLAAGNPSRSIAPTQPADDAEEPEAGSPSPSVTLSTPPVEPTEEPTEELDPEQEEVALAAADWLADLREALSGDQVLALPYGDPDVAAAAKHAPELYERALVTPGTVLQSWGVSTSPALGSPSGYLDPAGIALADKDTTTLVTDEMFGAAPPAVADTGRQQLVVTSSGAAAGGPPPGDRLSPVALRQRVLSEAALRMLDPGDRPLVMMLPVQWNPTDVDAFFAGLDVPWLDLSTVADATDRPAAPVDTTRLTYPKRQAARELGPEAFDAVEELISAGERLQNLLARNDQVAAVIADQALTGTSYAAREAPRAARASVDQSQDWVESRLRSVEVDAPPGVTLSGDSGSFGATLTNDLDQPVTVVITARSDDGLEVSDSDPIPLGPESQTTILLDARTLRLGVHNVTLYVTDVDGNRLGSTDTLPVRSAQVSTVIWVIMATGGGILFLAIAVRLVRRIRHRNDPPPADDVRGLEAEPAR